MIHILRVATPPIRASKSTSSLSMAIFLFIFIQTFISHVDGADKTRSTPDAPQSQANAQDCELLLSLDNFPSRNGVSALTLKDWLRVDPKVLIERPTLILGSSGPILQSISPISELGSAVSNYGEKMLNHSVDLFRQNRCSIVPDLPIIRDESEFGDFQIPDIHSVEVSGFIMQLSDGTYFESEFHSSLRSCSIEIEAYRAQMYEFLEKAKGLRATERRPRALYVMHTHPLHFPLSSADIERAHATFAKLVTDTLGEGFEMHFFAISRWPERKTSGGISTGLNPSDGGISFMRDLVNSSPIVSKAPRVP